ncbi:MAG: cysteine--tRNA ligase [Bdellovibrionota bacterium]
MLNLRFYNTETRKVEDFKPIDPREVKMYCCGPTVYNYAHIGNLRAYIFEDVLRKTIKHAGYNLKHVMNITDVGHLTSDLDTGEDKMLVAAKREQKDVLELARYYESAFFEDTKALNIERPDIVCRATETIDEIIKFIVQLDKKGYVYVADGNVYFDTSKFKNYGKMAGLKLDNLLHGLRVKEDKNKRNKTDFVLWFTNSKYTNHILSWPSPWGEFGYPGWNIECSAMAIKHLGERLDIHCGGIDHINVHHTNEIAQSEGLLGHKWCNFWMHGAFLEVKSGKMSKSTGEFLTLKVLKEKGYDPICYRYLCLTAHYRSPLSFTFESLDAAKSAYNKLKSLVLALKDDVELENKASNKASKEASKKVLKEASNKELEKYQEMFDSFFANDLDTPKVISNMWIMLRDESLSSAIKLKVLNYIDRILSLGIDEFQKEEKLELSQDVKNIIEERKQARANKDWQKSDELRDKLLNEYGLEIKDVSKDEFELKKA